MTLPDAAAQPGADAREDVVDVSTIRSKVQAPPVRASTLERPRLLEWLADHATDRIKVIAADAGYGKTTLLADFARRTSARCLWYRLEPNDGDWVTWINYLIAAVREIVPDFAQPTASLLGQMAVLNPSREIVLGSLMSELASIDDAPTMLILDDFHLVDDREDVHAILGQLFERAPPNLTFIISSRRVPELRLGRFVVAGEVAQLGTEDLRFSRDETAELFAVAYGHPLEPDLVGEVDARTEGWGASLQLVDAAIRNRPPSEARAFIHSLSGAEGRLYDYLAEEVLSGLDDPMRQVLVHASLLERVVPEFVAAALSAGGEAPRGDVSACLSRADDLGLMGRSTPGSRSRRIHPLLHDFLARHLAAATSLDERCRMHLSVARVAEPQDWLTACHHFIEGGQPQQAMRVLSASATRALGSGAWGAVWHQIARMDGLEPTAAVQVVRARHLASLDDIDGALLLLENLDESRASAEVMALARLTRVGVAYRTGQAALMSESMHALVLAADTPEDLRDIAQVWLRLVGASAGGELAGLAKRLTGLANKQARQGHHYYAAISLHNATHIALARGQYLDALRLGDEALAQFGLADGPMSERDSTRSLIATSAWELGYKDRAEEETAIIEAATDAEADAYAECAWVAATRGDGNRAQAFMRLARHAVQDKPADLAIAATVDRADAFLRLVDGDASGRLLISGDGPLALGPEPDFLVRRLLTQSMLAIVADAQDAVTSVQRGLQIAELQGAYRYEPRLAFALHAAAGTSAPLRRSVGALAASGELSLLEMADVVVKCLHLLEPTPPEVESSVTTYPGRWLPLLRRQMEAGNVPAAHAAARLLARHGSLLDAPRLVAFERTYMKGRHKRVLSDPLVKRTSPVLRVHDLGRTVFEVGSSLVTLAQTRRKAASLLMFLITRPNQTAPKEQVLDELWPDLDPASASNSLNQTLYFLRRDIDPWYDDGVSADYVVNESELLWLDTDLVTVDSVRFHTDAARALTKRVAADEGPTILERYRGRFAPEFEYEEWAIGWRERAHATYLLLVSATEAGLVARGSVSEALDLLVKAHAIDPESLDLEADLVGALQRAGALAAATEQYAHFAKAYERELGLKPPPFAHLAPDHAPRIPSAGRDTQQ